MSIFHIYDRYIIGADGLAHTLMCTYISGGVVLHQVALVVGSSDLMGARLRLVVRVATNAAFTAHILLVLPRTAAAVKTVSVGEGGCIFTYCCSKRNHLL